MNERRLFAVEGGQVTECVTAHYSLEREIQRLFEANLESLLGVRFVASEFRAGPSGRIDTLGIYENGFPVIIEYKLDRNRTVINQGMSYMAWIKSYQAEFWKVVLNKLGKDVADSIDFTSVRLICIATDFSREDLGAYELMPSHIDLVRYRRFGESHLLLERIQSSDDTSTPVAVPTSPKGSRDKPVAEVLKSVPGETRELFQALEAAILEQGDDVTKVVTKIYIAFKRTQNFASIEVRKKFLRLFLHLNPDHVELGPNMRDVRRIGHGGTGNLEVKVESLADIETIRPYIERAYAGE